MRSQSSLWNAVGVLTPPASFSAPGTAWYVIFPIPHLLCGGTFLTGKLLTVLQKLILQYVDGDIDIELVPIHSKEPGT